jgi:hypothetical protein
MDESIISDLFDPILDRSQVRRIISQRGWDAIYRARIEVTGGYDVKWIRDCARVCEQKNIRLEDISGAAFTSSSKMTCLISQL